MNKKTQRERDRQKRLFELSILIPSFHYLYIQLKVARKRHVEHDPKKLPKEFILTDTLVKKLARIIKAFQSMQLEAITVSNTIKEKRAQEIDNINTFLLGLHLLDIHYNLKEKKLYVNHMAEFLELSDYVFDTLDKTVAEHTILVARLLYLDTIQYHAQEFGYYEERENIAFRDENLMKITG